MVIDDSALMRRVYCDIIEASRDFAVGRLARNGREAWQFLQEEDFDALILDVHMPGMDGLELLEKLRQQGRAVRVVVASADSDMAIRKTLEALALGAMDFVAKPDSICACLREEFASGLLSTLDRVCGLQSRPLPGHPRDEGRPPEDAAGGHAISPPEEKPHAASGPCRGAGTLVAIAASTGGPRSLQTLLGALPANLAAPVLVVQHMPPKFTASLAERLDQVCGIRVREACEGESLRNGVVYLAKGGYHMTVQRQGCGKGVISLNQDPPREGVRPSANTLFESLANSCADRILCVVLTGMGTDGTEGVAGLAGQMEGKELQVIAQDEDSCVVYGMPRSLAEAGLATCQLPLEEIAREIVRQTGVV